MDGTSRIDELEQKFIENSRRYFAPLANEYRKSGNPHQAIAICRAHLAQLPGHMSGQIVYGQALFEVGEYAEARTVFENALAMDRENLVALRHLGDLALKGGETAAARQWYAKVLELDPKDAAVISLVDEIDAASDAQSPAGAVEESAQQPGQPEVVEPEAVAAATAAAVAPVATSAMSHSDEDDNLISEELGVPIPPPQAFVTETMAELYLAQGFRDRALDVYRQLEALHPEDERLRARIAELDEPAVEAAALGPPVETTAPAEPERIAAQLSVRDFFASLGRRRPSSRSDGSATNGAAYAQAGTESFAADPSGGSDARAAAQLAGAFGNFGGDASGQGAPAATTAPAAPGKESEEDVASFRAWLDGLTG